MFFRKFLSWKDYWIEASKFRLTLGIKIKWEKYDALSHQRSFSWQLSSILIVASYHLIFHPKTIYIFNFCIIFFLPSFWQRSVLSKQMYDCVRSILYYYAQHPVCLQTTVPHVLPLFLIVYHKSLTSYHNVCKIHTLLEDVFRYRWMKHWSLIVQYLQEIYE